MTPSLDVMVSQGFWFAAHTSPKWMNKVDVITLCMVNYYLWHTRTHRPGLGSFTCVLRLFHGLYSIFILMWNLGMLCEHNAWYWIEPQILDTYVQKVDVSLPVLEKPFSHYFSFHMCSFPKVLLRKAREIYLLPVTLPQSQKFSVGHF